MTVEEAIAKLQKLPPKMKLFALDDSSCTTREVTSIRIEDEPDSYDGMTLGEEEPVVFVVTSS